MGASNTILSTIKFACTLISGACTTFVSSFSANYTFLAGSLVCPLIFETLFLRLILMFSFLAGLERGVRRLVPVPRPD